MDYVEVDLTENFQSSTTEPLPKEQKHRKFIPEQRIVDQPDQPINDEAPDQSRFLSVHNQRVLKETKVSRRGEFRNSAHEWQKKFQPASHFFKSFTQSSSSSESIKSPSKDLLVSALPPISPQPLQPNYNDRKPTSSADTQDASLTDKESEGSATLDYLPDIEEGMETLLSTREFVYYTYYRRIRNQLHQFWTPKVRNSLLKIYKQGRRIASDADLVTRCLIILSSQGRLIKVFIIGQSGFKELDEAAFEALKEASPFRNPPKGMIDPDGLVRIRWNFIIES